MTHEFEFSVDISAVSRIEAVPTLLRTLCRLTGMGFAAIARVTHSRWVCLAVHDEIQFGLRPGGELKVETTICKEVRERTDAVVIEHVAQSEVYCSHPTPAMYGFQSYISVPIVRKDGSFFGTLCAIDPRPATLNAEAVETFRVFAALVAFHLDAVERVASSEASLLDERATAELREQFIAVLGHDLRNPLAAIAAGTELLENILLSGKPLKILGLMQASVARMSALIDNVLDFARGRLGGGLTLDRRSVQIEPTLVQIVDELRASHPDRVIEFTVDIPQTITCGPLRLGQLFSNLLGNALSHGRPGTPVLVDARVAAGKFTLSVVNSGDPIPPSARKQLFSPFSRGAVRQSQQGLGLGLYIASEIAKAHGGTIEVRSTSLETRFTFAMPCGVMKLSGSTRDIAVNSSERSLEAKRWTMP